MCSNAGGKAADRFIERRKVDLKLSTSERESYRPLWQHLAFSLNIDFEMNTYVACNTTGNSSYNPGSPTLGALEYSRLGH